MDVAEIVEEVQERIPVPTTVVRVPVKHTNLGIRSHAMDMSTMVELTSFSTLGKIQPFLVSISTTAALVVDLHCHLLDKEVCGYLGGHWDINAHNLAITSAFPCRYIGKEKSTAAAVEAEISRAMEWKKTTLVGWYHSHPRSHASPSLRDVDSQLDYQIKMKGVSDNGYVPCVGLICSPYNTDSNCYESNFNVFWSMPPPENRPHEYPRPMLLSYSLSQEHFLPQDALDEIKKTVDFYRSEGVLIDFKAIFSGTVTYLERLRSSLASKLPRNQSNGSYWDVIREIVYPGAEDPTSDPFAAVKYPVVPDSLPGQPGLNPSGLFIAPVNFKPDNVGVSVPKPFGVPSTSRDNGKSDGATENSIQTKDAIVASKHKLLSEFTSGELTVSVKNSKCDYDFTTADFTKVANLLTSDSSANKTRPTPDFPLADISQISKFPDFSKFASFSPADLAKLSGFSVNDFAKTPSAAYVCNIANLFAPLGKTGKEPSSIRDSGEARVNDFISTDGVSFGKAATLSVEPIRSSEDYSSDQQKKHKDLSEAPKPRTDFSSPEELSISNVKPDFGAMLDMTMHPKKSIGEGDSLNLSKDR